jgi:son of sevenless
VHRLKATWSEVAKDKRRIYDQALELMSVDNNHSRYRAALFALKDAETPCVPFIGVFLKDLVFTDGRYKSFLLRSDSGEEAKYYTSPAGEKFVNWRKRQRMAETVNEILNFQQTAYGLTQWPKLQVTGDWCDVMLGSRSLMGLAE